jgi:TolA-binding protein
LAAGKQLEKLQQVEHARRLYRELVRDFPASPAAAEAQARIGHANAPQ